MVAHVAELRRFVETKLSELVSVRSPHLPLTCVGEEGGDSYEMRGKSGRWERMEWEAPKATKTTTISMEETQAIAKRVTTNVATKVIPRKMENKKVEHLSRNTEENYLLKKLLFERISNVNLTARQMEKDKTNLPTKLRLRNSATLQMTKVTSITLFPIIFHFFS